MPRRHRVDLAIITAIPLEAVAALTIFDHHTFQTYKDTISSQLYHIGFVSDAQRQKQYTVLIAIPNRYGAVSLTKLATQLRNTWNPQYFALVGIAGAMGANVHLGDVVVSSSILEYALFKVKEGVPDEGKPRLYPVRYELSNAFRQLPLQTLYEHIGMSRPVELDLQRETNLHVGLILSGDAIVASTVLKQALQNNAFSRANVEAIATEMEGYGLADALDDSATPQISLPVPCVIVKGISDYADETKADGPWREYAAHAAIGAVKAVLKTGSLRVVSQPLVQYDGIEPVGDAEKYNWYGDMYYQQGKFTEAQGYYEAGMKAANNELHSVKMRVVANLARNLTRLLLPRGDIDDAAEYADIAVKYSRLTGNQIELADSIFLLALVRREQRKNEPALELLENAQVIYTNNENPLGIANTLRWRAYIHFRNGDHVEALKLFRQSLNHFNKTGLVETRIPDIAELYDMISRVYREMEFKYRSLPEDYSDVRSRNSGLNLPASSEECLLVALENMSRGKDIAERTGDNYRLAQSWLSYLIFYYRKSGHDPDWFSQFMESYQEGISLTKTHDYKLLRCVFEHYVGDAYFYRHRYMAAFQHYAENYCASLGVRPEEREKSIEHIIAKLRELANKKKALKYLRICIKYIRQHNLCGPEYLELLRSNTSWLDEP